MVQPPSLPIPPGRLSAEARRKKRLLLADDHAEFLEDVRTLLQEHYDIAGAVSDGRALTDAAQSLDPDLIISDVSMPLMSGFEAVSALRSLGVGAKIIFLSVQCSPAYVRKARSLGAHGYVLKPSAMEELLTAVSRVLDGETFVSPRLALSW